MMKPRQTQVYSLFFIRILIKINYFLNNNERNNDSKFFITMSFLIFYEIIKRIWYEEIMWKEKKKIRKSFTCMSHFGKIPLHKEMGKITLKIEMKIWQLSSAFTTFLFNEKTAKYAIKWSLAGDILLFLFLFFSCCCLYSSFK